MDEAPLTISVDPGPGYLLASPRRAAEEDALVARLTASGRLALARAFLLVPARRGAGLPGPVTVTVDGAAEGETLLLVRHPSGAVTLHRPVVEPVRRGERGATFRVRPFPPPAPEPRRGAARSVALFVLRVVDAVAGLSLASLARDFEQGLWRARGLSEGLVHVTREGLEAGKLPRADRSLLAPPPARNLLLVHGTFSHAAAGFGELAYGGAFERLASPYGGRVVALEHFTVGKTPEENARDLLAALPHGGTFLFDAVTHSRGGLVLRTLHERPAALGPAATRFRLGRGVLAAVPNLGTPLATPARWEETLGWLVNLVDLLPRSPFALLLEFVLEGMLWLARSAGGTVPGLHAMDAHGEPMRALAASADPSPYAALVTRFAPEGALLARLADLGLDGFFGEPHDLVVPTEGGFHLTVDGVRVPQERVAFFGPGGRLGRLAGPVHHLNLFARKEAVDFVAASLAGEPYPLAGVETHRRGAAGGRQAAAPPAARARLPRPQARAAPRSEPLELTLLPGDAESSTALLLARWGGARVVERFERKGPRWRDIIRGHERLRGALEGRAGSAMPSGAALRSLGTLLFETLFPREVRRLYDEARAGSSGQRLAVTFTSLIDWVAEKPWELAYDPLRQGFLAVEDVLFVRNVVTAVPAEPLAARPGPLSILVAVAQPSSAASLEWRREAAAIEAALAPLVTAGLARVTLSTATTPEALHEALGARRQHVLHFVGHGAYDEASRTGSLLFEGDGGAPRSVDAATLRALFSRRAVRLAVLNACESGRGGRSGLNRGVAPALVAGGVRAVVANQYSVLDASAVVFSRELYRSLALGRSLGEAVREARLAVVTAAGAEAPDWAVPVVYARDASEGI